MRIALLHDSILPAAFYGGIERIVMALAEEYERRGHSVVILSRKGSQIKGFASQALPENFLQLKSSDYVPSDVDFLHSHQPLPIKPSIPFLVTIHGNGHPHESYWPNTNFLSQSHARNHAAKYFIYNGVDPARYPFVSKKEDYFVFLARTTWRVKNVKTAIDWANDLGVRLEIMGGNGISRGKIHYNGLADEAQKLKLLSNAKALIYPTNWDEPCAAAPLEALACGTPVIATGNGCMPELVRDGTGVICKSYDELLKSKSDVEKVSPSACRQAVEQFFSLARMADDYLNLFQKIREVGDLDQSPHYNFNKSSVTFLYKPTLINQLRIRILGKI